MISQSGIHLNQALELSKPPGPRQAAVAIERVLVGCDRRHLYAAQERRNRGEPMTSEDLQAHYRTELARMLGPEGGRYVNPKTTAWMLKHTAATEGGTYTPETGART